MSDTEQAIDRLIERLTEHYRTRAEGLPEIEHDSEWPSLCELPETLSNGKVKWQPVKSQAPQDFSNIERALELTLHPDIKAWYTRYWSSELALKHPEGPVFLLQVWNEQDFANLQENLIGHVLMKRRLKQRCTLFFGLTDEEELLLTMLNDSGEIWLETVGREVERKLADSLAEFLDALTPA